MAVKINRVYPLAYMAKEKGKGSAPWSEAEEFRLQEEWTVGFVSTASRFGALTTPVSTATIQPGAGALKRGLRCQFPFYSVTSQLADSMPQKRMHSLEDDLDRLKQMCDGLEVTAGAFYGRLSSLRSPLMVGPAESIDEADVSDQTLEDYHQTNQKSSFLRNLSSAQIIGLAQKAQEEYGSESSNGQAEVEDNLRASRSW